jgi:hypothetical protein
LLLVLVLDEANDALRVLDEELPVSTLASRLEKDPDQGHPHQV